MSMLKFVFGKLWNSVEELDFVQPQVELPYTYVIVTLYFLGRNLLV